MVFHACSYDIFEYLDGDGEIRHGCAMGIGAFWASSNTRINQSVQEEEY
jgi:hypothetical protein